MRIKQSLRLVALVIVICIASMIPVPIKFHRKDNLPSYNIEQIDKKDDNEDEEENYQAFS